MEQVNASGSNCIRPLVRISDWTVTVLTEVLRSFAQFLKENFGINLY
jgi:hypothetical protein